MPKTLVTTLLWSSLFAASAAFSQNASIPGLTPGARYVALGSSFAAGPGIPDQLGSCGRSDHNYSHLVASALGLTLTDASCSGATTDHILNTAQGDEGLQIDAISPDTALVTVTIGGNDISFTSSTFACSGTSADKHCTANLDQAKMTQAQDQLPAKLGAVLDTIKARAPRAVIVVVTYPRVFLPDATSCSELELSKEDTVYLEALGQTLEDAFASVSSSRQVLMADAYVRAEGHGPCSASERWVNGANVAESGVPFHPTAEGHSEMARLVLAALEE